MNVRKIEGMSNRLERRVNVNAINVISSFVIPAIIIAIFCIDCKQRFFIKYKNQFNWFAHL